MNEIIKLTNLTKIYEGAKPFTALKNINLTISGGEFVAIMGPSGSGKSTLLHILGCLDYPGSGEYLLSGQKITRQTSGKTLAKIRNERIGFIFQSFNLLPRTAAVENVKLPLLYSSKPTQAEKLAQEALNKVGLGKKLLNKPSELSGGEQQRVAIARAIVTKPQIILADEPTGNLDSKSGLQIIEILKKLNLEGTTVILVTHDGEIAKNAMRTIELKDGKII